MIKNYSVAQSNPFVGRKKELTDINSRLVTPECRLLTLTGAGGTGKTRLAIEAARSVTTAFPQGGVFIGLQSLVNSDLLVPTIAHALGLTFYGEDEPETQLFNYLREKSLLLLLDNFEQLLQGAFLISAMIAHAPGIKILVTSREPLNLTEEWLYPLKGMSTPPSIYSGSLEDYEAVQLFLYHARRVQPNFDLAAEHESIIHICNLTAGFPLAIELAASWLKGLTASQIALEMRRNLDFLSTTTRNVEERHRSIRAVFDQSWKLLSENERLIFARLSVFRGEFYREAAEQVAETSLSSLVTLVEKSLLQMEISSRFGIHELLRQYGVEKLDEYGETDTTHEKLTQYYAQLMLHHEAALKQPNQLTTMQAIENDFENIRLAWHWASKKHPDYLHSMLNGLYLFGFLRSRYRETIDLFQYTLELPISDPVLLGRLLTRRWGYLHWWYEDDYQDALSRIQYALEIARDENDTFEVAFSNLMIAYALIGMRRYAEAIPSLESSKTLFETVNEPYYVCWVLHRLGYTYSNFKRSEKGRGYTEQSLVLARAAHNRLALVICLYNLGSDFILKGDYLKGRHYCAEALQVATESEHQGQIAHALSMVALCDFCQGDFDAAQRLAEQSQVIIEDINLLAFQAYNLAVLILIACLREDYSEGIRLRELGKRHSTNKMGLQLLNWALAALSCGLGNREEARVYIQQLLALEDADESPAATVWVAPSAAYVVAETGAETAVELLAWVYSYPDTSLQSVRQWPLLEHLQAQLQADLGPEAYLTHWQKGKTLSFDSVNRYLRNEFGITNEAAPPERLLTTRENEVLQLMATGLTNVQIAEQLVIGVGTVKTHTLSIYRKLEVANRTQAILRAQELGILPT